MKNIFLNLISLSCFVVITLLGYFQDQIVVAMVGGCFIGFFASKVMSIVKGHSNVVKEGKNKSGIIKIFSQLFYH